MEGQNENGSRPESTSGHLPCPQAPVPDTTQTFEMAVPNMTSPDIVAATVWLSEVRAEVNTSPAVGRVVTSVGEVVAAKPVATRPTVLNLFQANRDPAFSARFVDPAQLEGEFLAGRVQPIPKYFVTFYQGAIDDPTGILGVHDAATENAKLTERWGLA